MYIGVDLGTTNSAVSVYNDSEIKICKTAEGADTLASAIYIDKRGRKLFGQRAYHQAFVSPKNVATIFKRKMGTSSKIYLEDSSINLTPEECSAEILKQLMGQVSTEMGSDKITGVVITIPAAFNQMQSEATLQSAKEAGLEKVILLQEPIAAAMTAMSQSKNKNGQFLVYDLGGGTFDLALVQSVSGTVNIIAHEGENMLGGVDFDVAIVNAYVVPWLKEKFDLPNDYLKHKKYQNLMGIARLAAEKAKIELSTRDKAIVSDDDSLDMQDESGNDIYLDVELERRQVENLIYDEIEKTINLSKKMLKDNGYNSKDIDRIVFIGGPTKMPCIRDVVPKKLGIPSDLQIDPMTAVSQGASIYCESRVWGSATTSRKDSRASDKIKGAVEIEYSYQSRHADDKTKIHLKATDIESDYEVQIDDDSGWTSGCIAITSPKISIEVPLNKRGDNEFNLIIFDKNGQTIKEASKKITITRTHASAVIIPATQNIMVKARKDANSTQEILITIIKKGEGLPTKGEQRFIVLRELNSNGNSEHLELDFELFEGEHEGSFEGSLPIGLLRILPHDLEEGMKIREGDEIIFNWEMSDSRIFTATAELPSTGQNFSSDNFYIPDAGHQSYDLDNGIKIAESVLQDAKEELKDVENAVGDSASEECEGITKEIDKQYNILHNAAEGDTTRSVTEKTRAIRQKISKLKNAPNNRGKVLRQEILKLGTMFDQLSRAIAEQGNVELFDMHKNRGLDCIEKGTDNAIDEAEQHLAEMDRINALELWNNPAFLLTAFKDALENRHLASDQEKYDILLEKGADAIKNENVDELRRILFALNSLKVSIAGTDPAKAIIKLASIMAIVLPS